jgi:hypothetical protein
LCEPLISTQDRVELDSQMSEIGHASAEWLNTWFAGMLASTVRSLPAEDPWRRISAAFYPKQGQPHVYTYDSVDPPQVTGSRSKGKAFGTRRDHTDMIIPEFNDWLADLQLAAVTKEIDDWSAALIGFAGGGFSGTLKALEAMCSEIVDERKVKLDPATRDLFEISSEALKYVIHRRREYVGLDDEFVWSKGFQWITRTDQILSGREFSESDLDDDIEESKVADGDYSRFRLQ